VGCPGQRLDEHAVVARLMTEFDAEELADPNQEPS